MRRKYTKLSNIIITLILTIFGVGCDKYGSEAYGTPYATHNVKGTVKGASSTKIEGVKVTLTDKRDEHTIEVTKTDELGKYEFKPHTAFPIDTEYQISFEDIDGEKNGSYEDKTTEVTILKSELTGGGDDWFYGSASKDINVQLDEKE